MAKATRKGATTKRQTVTKKAASDRNSSSARKPSSVKKKTSLKKKPPKKKTVDKKKADSLTAVDKRGSSDRRDSSDRRIKKQPVVVEQRKLKRRVKVNRRRQIDPTTCERDYSLEEIEFMNALEVYKRRSGRMFPTCSEVLEVIQNLGYKKVGSGAVSSALAEPSPVLQQTSTVAEHHSDSQLTSAALV